MYLQDVIKVERKQWLNKFENSLFQVIKPFGGIRPSD